MSLHRQVVILTDRPDRSNQLVDAARSISRCRVSGPLETWADLEDVQGVIADISLDQATARHCLSTFVRRCNGRRIPLMYIARTRRDSELQAAYQHGATACFPGLTLPAAVVAGLFRQIAPEKTVTDLIVEHSFERADVLFTEIFESARAGVINTDTLDAEIDPVLEALRQGGLQRWLNLVHVHDDLTVRHCLLVAGLVTNFAICLRLPEVDRAALVRAGILHDVGKALIPPAILNKPGPLNFDETLVMRTHPVLGHELLLAADMNDPVALAATRNHHEMLDGSGYPDGLGGKAIIDPVRLLTICDIYAALTERRPYRPAMIQSEALPILRRMSPIKLELALVEAFASSLG